MDQTPGFGTSLDALPESFSIPPALVERWFATPAQQTVEFGLTRGDLDHFYNSVNRCIEAQWTFQDCMVDFTAGRASEANAKLRLSQRRLVEAQNSLKQLMASIMASAKPPSV